VVNWPKKVFEVAATWGHRTIYVGLCTLFALTVWIFTLPPDAQHGHTVRIMFIHVPAAWWAMGIFTAMAGLSAFGLILKQKTFILMAQALSPYGAMYALISLITGMIWGKVAWGAWWVWDARLTSMLFFFCIYIAHMNLCRIKTEGALKLSAFVAIIGWLNIPVIKWSVSWWTTLHQPASLSINGYNAIDFTYLWPLISGVVAFGIMAFGLGMLNLTNKYHTLKHL
jgi:heme exporter protein C